MNDVNALQELILSTIRIGSDEVKVSQQRRDAREATSAGFRNPQKIWSRGRTRRGEN